jgi:uncharacterized protein DUF928
MKPVNAALVILTGFAFGWPATWASEAPVATAQDHGSAVMVRPVSANEVVYKPPKRGAPGGRVGGGTRGIIRGGEEQWPLMLALAPDHVGLTMEEQPSVYWYVSTPISGRVEFTVIESSSVKPILETALPSRFEAGVHRIRLTDYGVRLASGVSYRWFVALVVDAGQRSKDIIAGGLIERVRVAEAPALHPLGEDNSDRAARYAEAGFWYDAIAVLSDQIQAAPVEPKYRKLRASLAEQVDLPEVAAYDRNGLR